MMTKQNITPQGEERLLLLSRMMITLTLTFDKGAKRLFDMKPFLKDGTILELLKDKSVSSCVYLDEYGVVSWDNDPSIESRETVLISASILVMWIVHHCKTNT